MGSSASKKGKVKLEPSLSDYPAPSPPSYYIDDLKEPIHKYLQDRLFDDDGLPWAEVLGNDTNNKQSASHSGHENPRQQRPVTKLSNPTRIRLIRSITLLGKGTVGNGATSTCDRHVHTPFNGPTQGPRSQNLHPGSTTFANAEKLDFSDIDRHARLAGKAHRKTFDSLLIYLLHPLRECSHRQIYKARVLIAWLACQPIKRSLTRADISTPDGLLQMIASGAVSYATAYTILCRQVGLDCVLIEGVSKSFSYVPNDTLTPDMKGSWTAVHCEGSWQFVQPERICKKEGAKIESEGLSKILLDDFFMPAPEYFIHTHFPDDESWQLLPSNSVIPSTDTFLQLPCVFPSFFKLGLRLGDKTRPVLLCDTGICEVDLMCDHTNDMRLSLTYSLTLLEATGSSKRIGESKELLKPFVIHSRQNHRFHFEIKPPIVGKYKLDIFESFYGSLDLRVCQFTIVCYKTLEKLSHLPFTTSHMMWGPGLLCDDGGLLVPSHMVGIVILPPRSAKERHGISRGADDYQKLTLLFMLDQKKTKNVQFFAYLRGNTTNKLKTIIGSNGAYQHAKNENQMNDNEKESFYANLVSCSIKEDKHILEITVSVPHEGEFVLMITKQQYTIDKITKAKSYVGRENAVCAYILRASRDAQVENVNQRLAREELIALVYQEDPIRMQAAITKCRKLFLNKNDGAIYSAEMWLEYLTHRTNLNDSIHRRNIRIIDETLIKVARYRYRDALQSKIKRLFYLRRQLKHLQTLRGKIPALRLAAEELSKITDPQPPVHVTMAAILVMFGEVERTVEDWSFIRRQLDVPVGTGDAPIIKKIRIIEEVCPSKSTMKKVVALLSEYSMDDIRAAQPAALQFHMWAVKAIAILDETNMINEPFTTDSFERGYDEGANTGQQIRQGITNEEPHKRFNATNTVHEERIGSTNTDHLVEFGSYSTNIQERFNSTNTDYQERLNSTNTANQKRINNTNYDHQVRSSNKSNDLQELVNATKNYRQESINTTSADHNEQFHALDTDHIEHINTANTDRRERVSHTDAKHTVHDNYSRIHTDNENNIAAEPRENTGAVHEEFVYATDTQLRGHANARHTVKQMDDSPDRELSTGDHRINSVLTISNLAEETLKREEGITNEVSSSRSIAPENMQSIKETKKRETVGIQTD